ncbi:MAG: hypothetical protein K2X27_24835 [Candidatus Obscuribacterales bacterium]|nr:hypothetical protein [Candidatus Obscuribacterales bacterium]
MINSGMESGQLNDATQLPAAASELAASRLSQSAFSSDSDSWNTLVKQSRSAAQELTDQVFGTPQISEDFAADTSCDTTQPYNPLPETPSESETSGNFETITVKEPGTDQNSFSNTETSVVDLEPTEHPAADMMVGVERREIPQERRDIITSSAAATGFSLEQIANSLNQYLDEPIDKPLNENSPYYRFMQGVLEQTPGGAVTKDEWREYLKDMVQIINSQIA